MLWEEIRRFEDWEHYKQFKHKIETSEDWRSVVIEHIGVYVGQVCFWFQYIPTGEVWQLLEPDPPSAGSWEEVEKEKIKFKEQ